eukprot:TRINITY_DN2765_c0_g1_i1.p1 TRINITY_DN2765_c0_g1~~TRINITY_DN2765_c0_g1_i1.p1  ORF type:complete len:329 (-),score=68.94 TRINITY_DN2765_c0_g1_i1:296-1282(-)
MSNHLPKDTTASATVISTTPPPPPPAPAEKEADTNINPSALATYEEVAASPELFMETLEKLHKSIETKFMVPTIGGKTLDLHRLFVEVTSRGGIEKVIRDRRWKEVISVFNFPSSVTNASFVLRKYYMSLIHHYERVYFFRKEGCPISMSCNTVSASAKLQIQSAATTQEKASAENQATESTPIVAGCSLVGTIDGKFDNGYFVTINLGTDQLKGVLYHVPSELPTTQNSTSAIPSRRRRKRSRRSLKDPFRPKSNRSGYNFFFADHYARLRPLHYGEEKVISKKIGHLWSNLTEAEREVYQEKGVKDKERYRSEMLEYRKFSGAGKR